MYQLLNFLRHLPCDEVEHDGVLLGEAEMEWIRPFDSQRILCVSYNKGTEWVGVFFQLMLYLLG